MRKVLAIFLAAVLFLDIICLGVIFFTRDTSKNRNKNGVFERAVIMAVGNNVITDKIISQAAAGNVAGGYSFDPLY
ncbi:MAG: hypothetical protein IK097_07265, partial [Clostridia bacterium]|nr:hypothetical protein [Clostridia bacterium]